MDSFESMSKKPPRTDLGNEMQVIACGFSRTGTVSMSLALEKLLNGPVMHGGNICLLREEAFIRGWIKALQDKTPIGEKKAIIRQLLDGYVACADVPTNFFIEELVELYPNALFICTTRDPERWRQSMDKLLDSTRLDIIGYFMMPLPTMRWFTTWAAAMTERGHKIYKHDKVTTSALMPPTMLADHFAYLQRSIPPERLFTFDVKTGWAPLCAILGKPVPAGPFPHANDAETIEAFFRQVMLKGVLCWLAMLAAAAAAGWLAWRSCM